MNQSITRSIALIAIAVSTLGATALCQQSAIDLLRQALQNELQVGTVEVQLRAEVKRFRYTPEQMRQWRFSEDLIRQATEEMSRQPETETVHVLLRFDNRSKLFESVEEKGGASSNSWNILQSRSLTNDKATVSYQETRSERGDVRKELSRSAPKWPPLAWHSEIWRYRIWNSHLPNPADGMAKGSGVKIYPMRGKQGEYAIQFENVRILAQH